MADKKYHSKSEERRVEAILKARAERKAPADETPSEYLSVINDSGVTTYQKRLLVGTPTVGSIRMEWAASRYGQAIPANWSKVDMIQYMTSYIPLRYSISDAQNLIANEAVTKGYEWLLLMEDDTCPPPDGFIRFNEYMRSGKYPVVSGLYFTKSLPAEPMIYRGRGNSYYTDWKLGDKIMCDGVPTGMLLINVKLLKAVWDESPEYMAGGNRVRRVFENPVKTYFNEETGAQEALVGTTDLDFCKRVVQGDYLAKAGFPDFQGDPFPFMVDTNIACMQIGNDGVQYPIGGIQAWCAANGNMPTQKAETYHVNDRHNPDDPKNN